MPTLTRGYRGPILTARGLDIAWRNYTNSRAVGLRLAWCREQAALSQAELADHVGVSRRTIQRIEAGERGIRRRERAAVATALGCSLATLTAPAIALPPASSNGKAAA